MAPAQSGVWQSRPPGVWRKGVVGGQPLSTETRVGEDHRVPSMRVLRDAADLARRAHVYLSRAVRTFREHAGQTGGECGLTNGGLLPSGPPSALSQEEPSGTGTAFPSRFLVIWPACPQPLSSCGQTAGVFRGTGLVPPCALLLGSGNRGREMGSPWRPLLTFSP